MITLREDREAPEYPSGTGGADGAAPGMIPIRQIWDELWGNFMTCDRTPGNRASHLYGRRFRVTLEDPSAEKLGTARDTLLEAHTLVGAVTEKTQRLQF